MSVTVRIAIALGLVVVWTVGVWGPGDHWAATTPRSTERANHRLQGGEAARAVAILDRATRARQPGLDTLLVQAFASLALDDHEAAAKALDQALLIDGSDPQVWLGQCLLSTAQPVEWENACDLAISLGEVDPGCGAPLARATARFGRGDLKGAREDLARCRAIDPNETALSRLEAVVTAEQEIRDQRLRDEARQAERLAEARRRAAERLAREREARRELEDQRAVAEREAQEARSRREREERERAERQREERERRERERREREARKAAADAGSAAEPVDPEVAAHDPVEPEMAAPDPIEPETEAPDPVDPEMEAAVARELAEMEEDAPSHPPEEDDPGPSLSQRAALELASLTRRAVALRNDRAKRKLRRQIHDIREILDEEEPLRALEELDDLAEGRTPGLEEKLLRAEAQRQAGRTDDAIRGLDAIAIHLGDAGPLTVDGCVLASDLEQGALSETLCRRVDDRYTTRARGIAANALGLARWAEGRYAEAEVAFANSLALDTSDELFWSDAALSAAALGAVDLSLVRMRRALALDEDSIDVEQLATDPRFARWREDPRAQAALASLREGESP